MSLGTSKMDIDVHQFKKCRAVRDYQKSLVQSKLLCYMNDLRDKSVKPMLYPNIYFEFGIPSYFLLPILGTLLRYGELNMPRKS
jgi:hypothetical protein